MSMKQVLEILSAENKSGIGSKSQKAFSMNICQCVVRDASDNSVKVGELTMPKDSPLPTPGLYLAEFKIGVDYLTKKIGGILVSITPHVDTPEIVKTFGAGLPPSKLPVS